MKQYLEISGYTQKQIADVLVYSADLSHEDMKLLACFNGIFVVISI